MTFDRKLYKQQAKAMLKKNYVAMLIVCALLFFFGMDLTSDSSTLIKDKGISSSTIFVSLFTRTLAIPEYFFYYFYFSIIAVIVISILIFLMKLIIEIGGHKFFLDFAKGESSEISTIFWGFSNKRYKNILVVQFFRSLYIFLWTLLFLVPGIVKSYEYILVPYILAENPDINYKDALELSSNLTDGHKFDIFVMQLSFLGWYLPVVLLHIWGKVLVDPYSKSAYANMYLDLLSSKYDNHLSVCNTSPSDDTTYTNSSTDQTDNNDV